MLVTSFLFWNSDIIKSVPSFEEIAKITPTAETDSRMVGADNSGTEPSSQQPNNTNKYLSVRIVGIANSNNK